MKNLIRTTLLSSVLTYTASLVLSQAYAQSGVTSFSTLKGSVVTVDITGNTTITPVDRIVDSAGTGAAYDINSGYNGSVIDQGSGSAQGEIKFAQHLRTGSAGPGLGSSALPYTGSLVLETEFTVTDTISVHPIGIPGLVQIAYIQVSYEGHAAFYEHKGNGVTPDQAYTNPEPFFTEGANPEYAYELGYDWTVSLDDKLLVDGAEIDSRDTTTSRARNFDSFDLIDPYDNRVRGLHYEVFADDEIAWVSGDTIELSRVINSTVLFNTTGGPGHNEGPFAQFGFTADMTNSFAIGFAAFDTNGDAIDPSNFEVTSDLGYEYSKAFGVPEPSSVILLSLVGFGIMTRRTRRY